MMQQKSWVMTRLGLAHECFGILLAEPMCGQLALHQRFFGLRTEKSLDRGARICRRQHASNVCAA